MKVALADVMAKKHDTISLLRREIYHLEVRNSDTLKETSIKDDIIKELRRELKKSKHKVNFRNMIFPFVSYSMRSKGCQVLLIFGIMNFTV